MIPSNGTPEDLGRGSIVDGTMRGLGVHPFTEKTKELHLLADKASRHADLLATHHHDALPIEQLLGKDGRQAPKHMLPCINHHAPRADPRARHHLSHTLLHSLAAAAAATAAAAAGEMSNRELARVLSCFYSAPLLKNPSYRIRVSTRYGSGLDFLWAFFKDCGPLVYVQARPFVHVSKIYTHKKQYKTII